MIRRVMLSLIAGLLGMAFVIAADDPPADPEPPVRLKKKARPADAKENPPAEKEEPKDKPPEPMPEKKGKMEEEPPVPAEPEVDEQEVLNRVSRNMRTAEERLANKELGEGTRQLQRDIVEDLDKLIDKLNQQQNNSNNQGSGGQAGMQKQNQGGQQQTKSGGRRSGQKQTAKGSQKQGPGGQQQRPGQGTQQANNSGQGAGNTPGAGNGGPQGENEVADAIIKVWGHLPETLRQEMNAYSRQEYMSKYSEVIKQYYSTVAEKGRKKGD